MRGRLLSFEGIEGAGKSTLIECLQGILPVPSWVTREPGGTELAENIRSLLIDNSYQLAAETELLLLFAGRKDHIDKTIRPRLQRGEWVLSDRFVDASFAYQGGGRGLDTAWIEDLERRICTDVHSDLVIWLDLPLDVMHQRLAKRGDQLDRMERETTAFFQRVRQVYQTRSVTYPERYLVLDAQQATETLLAQIMPRIQSWFPHE